MAAGGICQTIHQPAQNRSEAAITESLIESSGATVPAMGDPAASCAGADPHASRLGVLNFLQSR